MAAETTEVHVKLSQVQPTPVFLLGECQGQGSLVGFHLWVRTRPCRKRRASAREDGGVSGVSSSCGARGGFLPRRDASPLLIATGEAIPLRGLEGVPGLPEHRALHAEPPGKSPEVF